MLDYFSGLLGNHPLPTFGNWTKAADYIGRVSGDKEELNELQKLCTDWWVCYKQRLRESVELFLTAPRSEEPSPFTAWSQSMPGWQLAELLRHQTARTLARRISAQFRRVVREGKLRKTAGV